MTEYAAPTVTESNGTISVSAPADAVIIGVIAGFDRDQQFVGRKVVGTTSTGAAATFPIPEGYVVAKSMFVYALPTEEAGRAIYDNLYDSQGNLCLDFGRLVSAGDAVISDIAGISSPE